MRYGGAGDLTQLTWGGVSFDHVAGQHLVSQLHGLVHIDTWGIEEGTWLQSTLGLIAREARELRQGGEADITHLADILIIQAIRTWIDSAPEADQSWLAALKDRYIGKALAAIHREPEKDWTVNSLARKVGLSCSGFPARFTKLAGKSAKRYLTQWRMQLARAQLQQTSATVAVLADPHGYQSEAAFLPSVQA